MTPEARRIADGPVCRSCPADFPFPATYIATPRGIAGEWPVCSVHVEFAMVAGWFPIRSLLAQEGEE